MLYSLDPSADFFQYRAIAEAGLIAGGLINVSIDVEAVTDIVDIAEDVEIIEIEEVLE